MLDANFHGAIMQRLRAAIITESRPHLPHFVGRSLRQLPDRRPALEKALIIRPDGRNRRLLQHDFRKPYVIRVRHHAGQSAPGQDGGGCGRTNPAGAAGAACHRFRLPPGRGQNWFHVHAAQPRQCRRSGRPPCGGRRLESMPPCSNAGRKSSARTRPRSRRLSNSLFRSRRIRRAARTERSASACPRDSRWNVSFQSELIRQRVNTYFGHDAISRIVFEPVYEVPPAPEIDEPEVDPETLAAMQETAQSVDDEALRAALENFAAVVLRSENIKSK